LQRKVLGIIGVMLLAAGNLYAATTIDSNDLTEVAGVEIINQSAGEVKPCFNTTQEKKPAAKQPRKGLSGTATYDDELPDAILCNEHNSVGSYIDNLSFNHIETNWDFRSSTELPEESVSDTPNVHLQRLPEFDLQRIHRYRDVMMESSFGPGVYSNLDIRLTLQTPADGSFIIELFDPSILGAQRFVDGPITHPFSPNDPLDGVYVSFKTNSHKEIRLYDSGGAQTSVQANAATAVLRSWGGKVYYFQIVSINGVRYGRLTRFENRNGYALRLNYKYQPADDLQGSESRLWQLSTVTDAHNRTGTFTYGAAQVSGRWCVSNILFPDGSQANYSYTDGYLSSAQLTNTTHLIGRKWHEPSKCTIVTYGTVESGGLAAGKRVYLTNLFTAIPDALDEAFPQSASLVRMVVTGDGVVEYMNLPHKQYTQAYIYERGGVLKHVYCGWQVKFATSWKLYKSTDTSLWGYASVIASFETNFEFLSFPATNQYQKWYRWEPNLKKERLSGYQRSFTYNTASQILSILYPDATKDVYVKNAFQKPLTYTDRQGFVTTYTYDARGNTLSKKTKQKLVSGVLQPTAETTTSTWEYYPAGDAHQFLMKKEVGPDNSTTTYQYDANHYLLPQS
jgi:YD repeat-containing protein